MEIDGEANEGMFARRWNDVEYATLSEIGVFLPSSSSQERTQPSMHHVSMISEEKVQLVKDHIIKRIVTASSASPLIAK